MINKLKNIKGVTLIVLVITIIVLLILAGTTIATLSGNSGVIKQTEEAKNTVETESLIQKIQADLFEEQTKKGRELTNQEKETIIKNYGSIETNENGDRVLTTTQGNYTILLSEIIKLKNNTVNNF